MAASATKGPKGQPRFPATDAPDLGVDEEIVADYAAKVGNRRVGTTAERDLAASSGDVWEGLLWGDTTTGLEYKRVGGAWVTAIAGNFGADGNMTITSAVLKKSFNGFVSLFATTNRINGTTFATNVIVGILPVGFRPAFDVQGVAATYGSGTPNQVTVSAATGNISLMTPSPAGHTVAQFALSFPV